MGWRFRKSINLGFGFRINLSKTGIGYSWGVPGYRVTKMANGGNRTTFSLPGTGISYVEQSGKNVNNDDLLYTDEIENYKNIPIEEIQDSDPILRKINKVMLLNRIANIMLFLTFGIYYHPSFILFLFIGLIIKLYISSSKKIGLYYEFDDESRKMYGSLKEAIIKLSNNKKMWQVTTSIKVYNKKYNAGAGSNIERNNAYITSKMPWYIKTNIEIYGLNLKNQKMFFTPDRVIVFQPFRKAFGCTYNDMELLISYTNFIESERVCSDAEIVNYTWKYANADGSRDLRFSNNKKYPICKYGELTIESPHGINTIIHFSNFDLIDDIKSNLIIFGNSFNKILSKTKNKKETKESVTKEIEKKVCQSTKKEEIIENNMEYEIPDISLIKDDQSKSFVDFYTKLNKEELEIPIGVSKKEEIIEKMKDMPNLLIGGTVMSGKTTFIYSVISNILLSKKPNEFKLLIYDSKKVDYSMFKQLPHLLVPIINDSKKLNVALKRILSEINRRFDLLENANVKSISRYNNMITNSNDKVPDILIIIDDLCTLNESEEISKKIEDITTNGWNVNVYMIVASNYPSAQILSTISKSNFPARLSFKVTSTQASQIIINNTGAEKLSGVGNALYTSRLQGKPIQVTVPYIIEEDVKNIVNKIESQYNVSLKNVSESENEDNKERTFVDPLYDDIVDFVISQGKASASLLQRRFRFGYNRALNAINLLEERGIIGPQKGSNPREVLVDFESEDE